LRPHTAIRGARRPNVSRNSASTIAIVSITDSRVIAAGTSASGRCVVTSATRKPPPTSIITTRGVCVRSAKNSVWPMNGSPASASTLFCTGPVTSASKSPAAHASHALASIDSTACALVASGCPGVTGAASGWFHTSTTPPDGANDSGS
jgi:hypothetical protein